MELSERNLRTLDEEGFSSVYEWFDKPDVKYPSHSHDYKTTILISEGSMDITVNGETKTYRVGDRIDYSHTNRARSTCRHGGL